MSPSVVRLGLALLKGTRHLDRDTIELDLSGPVGDRTWCLVDRAAARVLRTVENPRLLSLSVRPSGDRPAGDHPAGDRLTVTTLDGRTTEASTREAAHGIRAADYWGRGARIRLQDTALNDVFSEVLGRDVVLARAERGDVVYADPVSIVTTGALGRLSTALRDSGYAVPAPLDARFRATVTLDAEDDPPPGTRLRLGDAVVEVTDPLERCAVVDLDPVTGERTGSRVLEHLRSADGRLLFGVGARVVTPGAVTRSG